MEHAMNGLREMSDDHIGFLLDGLLVMDKAERNRQDQP